MAQDKKLISKYDQTDVLFIEKAARAAGLTVEQYQRKATRTLARRQWNDSGGNWDDIYGSPGGSGGGGVYSGFRKGTADPLYGHSTAGVWGDRMGVSIDLPTNADCDLAYGLGFRWIRATGADFNGTSSLITAQLAVKAHCDSIGMGYVWVSELSGHAYTANRSLLLSWAQYHADLATAGVHFFEIGQRWNEAAHFANHSTTEPWRAQAEWYTIAATAIKTVDETCYCMTPGMAPAVSSTDYGGTGYPARWPGAGAYKLVYEVIRVAQENNLATNPYLIDGVANQAFQYPGDPGYYDSDPSTLLANSWMYPGWGNGGIWQGLGSLGLYGVATLAGGNFFSESQLPYPYGPDLYLWTTFGSPTSAFGSESARATHFDQYFIEFQYQIAHHPPDRGDIPILGLFIHTLRGDWGIVNTDGSDKSGTTDMIRSWLAFSWFWDGFSHP